MTLRVFSNPDDAMTESWRRWVGVGTQWPWGVFSSPNDSVLLWAVMGWWLDSEISGIISDLNSTLIL